MIGTFSSHTHPRAAHPHSGTALSDRLGRRDNHLTLIRLTLSLLVIFSHTFALGGFGSEMVLGGNDKYGNLAVNCFFVLSGMLISASFARTESVGHFALKRFLRIVPAYWGALAVTALVLCPLAYWLSDGAMAAYWFPVNNSPFAYIAKNVAVKINQTEIADVFSANPYPRAVNGVLWTLAYELVCYGFVVIVGSLGLLRKHWIWPAVLLVLMAVNAVIYQGVADHLPASLSSTVALLHFLAYFVAGMMAYIYADVVSTSVRTTALAFAGLSALLLIRLPVVFVAYHVLAPPLLVLVIFGAAYSTRPMYFERVMPDLSYGMYIYGWVVQQSLVSLGAGGLGFAGLLASSLLITTPLAVVSYYGIERRCLQLKRSRVT